MGSYISANKKGSTMEPMGNPNSSSPGIPRDVLSPEPTVTLEPAPGILQKSLVLCGVLCSILEYVDDYAMLWYVDAHCKPLGPGCHSPITLNTST